MKTAKVFLLAIGMSLLCAPGVLRAVTLTGSVWLDTNGNGILNASESLSNVPVTVTPPTGFSVTWQDGTYSVEGLIPGGTYVVTMGPLAGYESTTPLLVPITVPASGEQPRIDFALICSENPDDSGSSILFGTLAVVRGTDSVTVVFQESTTMNDNSYGTNTVGWPRSHTFSDLVNSDKAEFRFTDATGKVVFDFYCDYISVKAGTRSGYGCLGVSGAEGRVLIGNAGWLLGASTSLSDNLADFWVPTANLLVNSPPTVSRDSYVLASSSPVAAWEFPIRYTVTVSGAAFGGVGNFGSVVIPLVHNSPPKDGGSNAAHQVPCLSGGTTNCGECKGGIIELTLQYLELIEWGSGPAVYDGTKAEKSKELDITNVGPFDGLAENEFTVIGRGSDRKMGSEISVYVNGTFIVTIPTSCSKLRGTGMTFRGPGGTIKITGGKSKDGGPLCPAPCGACKGAVTQLEFQYLGTRGPVAVYEGKKAEKSKLLSSSNNVETGGTFWVVGKGSDQKLGSEITIVAPGFSVTIPTECSKLPAVGQMIGNFLMVIDGASKDGGPFCKPSCQCKGGVTSLTLRYDGSLGPLTAPLTVSGGTLTVKGDDPSDPIYQIDGITSSQITVTITVSVNGTCQAKLFSIPMDCSVDFRRGSCYGPFYVVDGYSKDGGRLCPVQ
jgi:hypothetical protein